MFEPRTIKEWERFVNQNHKELREQELLRDADKLLKRDTSGKDREAYMKAHFPSPKERKKHLLLTALFALVILVAGLIILEIRGVIPTWVSVPVCLASLPLYGFLTGYWWDLEYHG